MGRMAFVPEGQADRSQAQSAWDCVPRKNRPVGYGMIGGHGLMTPPMLFWGSFLFCSAIPHSKPPSNLRIVAHTCANHTVPYGTALLGWRCSRHFVPGYDHAVPLGRNTFCAEAFIKLALMGFPPEQKRKIAHRDHKDLTFRISTKPSGVFRAIAAACRISCRARYLIPSGLVDSWNIKQYGG
jgi:hypothetical protein